MSRKPGDKAAWNGSECILWPILEMTREQNIIQDFILRRVARFTKNQRGWIIHWLRSIATPCKDKAVVESLVTMANCIERSPVKGHPPMVPYILMKARYPGKCRCCEKPHAKGDRIFWRPWHGALCERCGAKIAAACPHGVKMKK